MTTEHDLAHGRAAPRAPSPPDDDLMPGRGSRSSQLTAPSHPIAGGLLLRKARDANGVADDAEQAVAAAGSSSGLPLPEPIMRKFESSLGADLSGVRVHSGDASATAASTVGAKAYTMGNDIHFGAGYYDPSSRDGQHLLAHEVAHTVQQGGGSPLRFKLEVSTAGDATEVEADRAADAMVTGASVSIAAFAPHVQRKDEKQPDGKTKDADKAWAEDARTKERSVKAAAGNAANTVNGDAAVAVTKLRAALASYNAFEAKYNGAVKNFTSKVKEAMEQAEALRKQVGAAAELALAAASAGAGGEAIGKVAEVVETVNDKLGVLSAASELAGGTEPKKPEVKGPVAAELDWKKLISTAIDTLDGLQKQSSAIGAFTEKCFKAEVFLSGVIEGTGPDNPKTTADGQAADAIANNSQKVVAQLAGIKPGDIAGPASQFAADCAAHLDPADPRKLEQDMVMKWMAGLSKDQLDTIDDIDGYLHDIGVIDGKGSRLGVDTGNWTTDLDKKMIWMRSQIETSAIALVGKRATWMGATGGGGGGIRGQIRDEDGGLWFATGPAALGPSPGGEVQVNSYAIAELGKENSEWDHPGDIEMRRILHDKVTFTVTPIGPMGGGAEPVPQMFKPTPGGDDSEGGE